MYAGKPKSAPENYREMDYEGLKLYLDEEMAQSRIKVFMRGWWIFKELVVRVS